MKHHNVCRWMFTLFALAALAVEAAHGQACKVYGPNEFNAVKDEIYIDARTGRVYGRLSRRADEEVTVLLVNKNPFARSYRVSIKETLMGEPALAAFLPFIGGAVLDTFATKAETKASALESSSAELNAKAMCDPADISLIESQLKNLDMLRIALLDSADSVESLRSGLSGELAQASATYQASRDLLLDIDQPCNKLTTSAKALSTLNLPSTAKLSGAISQIRGQALAIAAVADDLDRFLANKPNCKRLAQQPLKDARALSALALGAVGSFSAQVAKVDEQLTVIGKEKDRVAKILEKPEPYVERHIVGPYYNASKITFEVTPIDPDGKEMAKEKLKFEMSFGSPFFSLTGGMVYSNLDAPKYARVSSATAAGAITPIQPVVGRTDGSGFRFLPMVMLNARLRDSKVPIYATLGVTAKTDDKGTTPEYLVGLSASFLKNLLYLTGGVYIGTQQVLEGGFKLGDPVPDKLDPIPTRGDRKAGFGFAISYRFK